MPAAWKDCLAMEEKASDIKRVPPTCGRRSVSDSERAFARLRPQPASIEIAITELKMDFSDTPLDGVLIWMT